MGFHRTSTLIQEPWGLEGTVSRDFLVQLFSQIQRHQWSHLSKIYIYRGDTGGNFATAVTDAGGNLPTGVIDTNGQQ